jgi:hypothetical protein
VHAGRDSYRSKQTEDTFRGGTGMDDDERPSWREIDKKRDRSSHARQEKKEKREGPKDRWNIARHKEALDRLFMGDKGTIEHEKLYNKIHKAYGSLSFLPTVQKYVEKYGPPDDMSTLLLLLDAKDKEIMLLAIEKLGIIYQGVSPREKEDIRRKLSILSLTDRSADIKEKASEILEQIRAGS